MQEIIGASRTLSVFYDSFFDVFFFGKFFDNFFDFDPLKISANLVNTQKDENKYAASETISFYCAPLLDYCRPKNLVFPYRLV